MCVFPVVCIGLVVIFLTADDEEVQASVLKTGGFFYFLTILCACIAVVSLEQHQCTLLNQLSRRFLPHLFNPTLILLLPPSPPSDKLVQITIATLT